MLVVLLPLPLSPLWFSVDRILEKFLPIQYDSKLKSKGVGTKILKNPSNFIEYLRISGLLLI